MKLHITRHGQPRLDHLQAQDDHQFPTQDPELTQLGMQQARRLGQTLARQNFTGAIHSSPYRRTLQTASIIADILDLPIALAPGFQEVIRWTGDAPWQGMSPTEIAHTFPRVTNTHELPWPWLLRGPESDAQLDQRIQQVLDQLTSTNNDTLLVGHGGTVFTAVNLLMTEHEQLSIVDRGYNWNCALTTFERRPDNRWRSIRFRSAAHLTLPTITANLETPRDLAVALHEGVHP